MAGVLLTLLASCVALTLTARASCAPPTPSLQNEGFREANTEGHTRRQATHAAGSKTLLSVQRLIEAAGLDVFHLDLSSFSSGGQHSGNSGAQDGSGLAQPPWFEGFVTSGSEAAAAAVTVGHPIRRMLSFFRKEAIELDAMFGMEDEGELRAARGRRRCVSFRAVEQRRGGARICRGLQESVTPWTAWR